MSIRAESISFSYGKSAPVFEGLDFELGEGVTVVLGPNGAGKSTLVRVLMGASPPTNGRVEIDGRSVHRMPATERARRLAYVSQRPSVASAFSVREVIALGRFALTPDEEAVEAQIAALALEDFADRPFASLSVGEQQRASLARALAQLHREDDSPERRVLLADEPTSAMDPRWVAHTTRVIRGLPGLEIDALIVLHDFTLASRLADRIVVLDADGRIACDGSPDEALEVGRLSKVFGTPFLSVQTPSGRIVTPEIDTH